MRINNDQVSSVVGLIIGVLIFIHALSYDLGSVSFPGAGLFPLLQGVVIILLCVAGLVGSSLQSVRGGIWKPVLKGKLWKRPLMILMLLLFYSLTISYLGFIITTALFVGFILRVLERQRWLVVIFGALLCSLVSYCLFNICLKTQLPVGLLGF